MRGGYKHSSAPLRARTQASDLTSSQPAAGFLPRQSFDAHEYFVNCVSESSRRHWPARGHAGAAGKQAERHVGQARRQAGPRTSISIRVIVALRRKLPR